MEGSQPVNSTTQSVYRVWCHPVGISDSAHFGGRRQRVYALVMTKIDDALVTCVRARDKSKHLEPLSKLVGRLLFLSPNIAALTLEAIIESSGQLSVEFGW